MIAINSDSMIYKVKTELEDRFSSEDLDIIVNEDDASITVISKDRDFKLNLSVSEDKGIIRNYSRAEFGTDGIESGNIEDVLNSIDKLSGSKSLANEIYSEFIYICDNLDIL